jgi:hypothetical protein
VVASGGSFSGFFQRSRERTHASREIRAAVRARAQGRTRDEARAILIEEMGAHGQDIPAQPWLDVRLDGVLAGDGPKDRAQATVEAVSVLGEIGLRMIRLLKTHASDDADTTESGQRSGFLKVDRSRSVEIDLDDDAQTWIGQVDNDTVFKFRDVGSMRLDLHLSTDGTVVAYIGERRVGVVGTTDAEIFRPCFSLFGKPTQILWTSGTRYKTPDGRWHLYVNLPDEHFARLGGLDIQTEDDLPPEALHQLINEPLPPTPSGRVRYDRDKGRWVDGSEE